MMDKALQFLDVQKQALLAPDLDGLGFVLTNRIQPLIACKQAVFWVRDLRGIRLLAASGNASIDDNGPYAQWLAAVLKAHVLNSDETVVILDTKSISDEERKGWAQYGPPSAMVIVLRDDKGTIKGGLWLERDAAPVEAEQTLAAEMSVPFSRALMLLMLQRRDVWSKVLAKLGRYKVAIWIALVCLALMPVRLTITAPAEIVAQSPQVVTVPFDGTLESINVDPGDAVKAGDVLAVMDRVLLAADERTARQELESARSALARLRRESLTAPEKKAELNRLQGEIETRRIEHEYARTLLQRAEITAPVDGVAVLSDKNTLTGQPVRTGQRIMDIADPAQAELLVRVPVDAMMPLSEGADLRFFLNVAPLSGGRASIKTIGYQASPDPDGLLTYKIRAALQDGEERRIGWKGTAKIYGSWSVLSYAVLRRPLAALRSMTGL